ncbi:MAG: tetratricopeptide repeat protein [Candidatus Nitrohelix vancouverensis]|uniref:Tetratricopeptide repeat protein n=1 Tax=Candidatus Nitrohelix vancouverensis TaxID=2705534 RepID=A0A7T0G3Q7_9BACT|nr:MAG: tetratricopeptide repeat protein [Candidatus Nitrohelix vancouverensis]
MILSRYIHLLLTLHLLTLGASPAFANEAESLYQQGDYESASQHFETETRENPEDLAIQYNLGNSRYKSGKFDQALESYQQSGVAPENPELQQFAVYNSGNALFKMGKLKEAESAFKKSLELNPKDMDAKFNLEFVRKQLEEQKKKRQQDDPKQQNQNKKPKEDKDADPSQSSQQQGPDSGNQQKNPPPSNSGGQTQTAKNQPPRPGEGRSRLSKEEADRRLNAISENRKELIQKQIAKNQASKNPPKVDW